MAPTKKRLPEPPTDDTVINNAALQFDEDDFEDEFDDEPKKRRSDFDDEEDIGLNDPDIEHLGDSPIVGGGSGRGRHGDLYGNEAEYAVGRAMSPPLYSQAAQFPTCSQLRVWKWENGIPVGLGAIDATATEEDLVRRFGSAMPKKGEGRAQFKMRPIDIRGQELGQEITLVISEHHAAIQALRAAQEEEKERTGPGGVHFINGGGGGEAYGEMGRMFEHALEAAESRSSALESALERERERIRQEDLQRAQERVDLATNAAQGVQVLTERMMQDESKRAERAMNMQNQQSQTLVTTLSSIFSQQQSMMQQSTDQQRRADEFRLEQERQRADRERRDFEERMRLQQQEWDRKRQAEREESDHKLKMEREEAQRRFEQHRMELDAKLQREREDMERKERKERDDAERRDRWLAEERTRREERIAREQSEREAERNRQHERMLKDAETSAQRDREHAERMMQLSKIEMENRANAGGMNVLGNAAGMLKQFGIQPNEILPKLFSPGEEEKGGGWLDALPSILGAAAEMAKSRTAPQPSPEEIAMMQRPALPPPGLDPRMYGADPFMGAPAEAPEMFRAPVMPPEAPEMPVEAGGEEESQAVEETPKQKQTRELSTLAAEAGLPLRSQRDARVELRNLVRKLRDSEQGAWQDHILSSLSTELSIYHYVQAVTVRAALVEAGADSELTDNVCAAMQASPMVPNDLRYDWGS